MLSVSGTSALSANNNTLIEIKTFVAANCSVQSDAATVVSLNNASGTVNYNTNGVVIGRITENCNNVDGYELKIASSNNGKLVLVEGGAVGTSAHVVGYNIGLAGCISNSVVYSNWKCQRVWSKSDKSTDLKVFIADGAFVNMPSGTYEDTLTVSVISN